MSGLLRRIRRPGAAEENRTEAIALPEPAHGSAPETAPVRADGSPLPAGVTPEDLERRSVAGRRGKVRRRARFLRRARELALRDLGGLVYEAHRRDQDGGNLVQEKVRHLGVIDAELQALEAELGTPRGETVLREPGVGGTCPRCGELHASDAHFCSRCGLDLTSVPAEAPAPEPAEAAAAEPEAEEATATEPATGDAADTKPAEPAASAETEPGATEATATEPAPSDAAAATPASAATPAEQPRGGRWTRWRRRSATSEAGSAEPARSEATPADPATSEATPAEPATTEAGSADPARSEATPADPATSEATPAEPATTEAPAAEQPTTDLARNSQAGNGRATQKDAPDPDPERSA